MYTIYVLRSSKNQKRYVGCTSKSAKERLSEHLAGSNKWTKCNGPFEIIHTELFQNKTDALRREKYPKSGRGRQWLDDNIPR